MRRFITASVFFLSIVFTTLSDSFAQETISCRQYNSEQGLSENVVYSIMQDKRGFIWAGTDFGLNRFDGYSFKKFYKDSRNPNSLSNNSVVCMTEDPSGIIWIGTFHGLNYYNSQTGQVGRCADPIPGEPFSLTDLYYAGSNYLIIRAEQDIWQYHVHHKLYKKMALPEKTKLISNRFLKVQPGRKALLVSVNEKDGLLILDTLKWEWKFTSLQTILPVDETNVSYYYLDSKERHYSVRGNEIRITNNAGVLLSNYQKKSEGYLIVSDIKESSSGAVWITTLKGLLLFDPDRNTIEPIKLKSDQRELSSSLQYSGLFNDRAGNVWMGSYGEGLFQIENISSPFRPVLFPGKDGNNIGGLVMGMHSWPGGNVSAHATQDLLFIIKNGILVATRKESSLLKEEMAHEMAGKDWEQIGEEQKKIISRVYENEKLRSLGFYLLGDTMVLFANEDSLYLQSPSGVLFSYKAEAFTFSASENYYWVATASGLIRFDKNNLEDTLITLDKNQVNSLSESWLYCTVQYGKEIWIGTKGGGLNRLNSEGKKIRHYTTEDGLPDNVIYSIVPDNKGNLWLSTNNGISRFQIATETFVNFSGRNGLVNSEYNRKGGVMGADGLIYFAGTSGIDYFDPDEIKINTSLPEVHFSEILVNGKEYYFSQNEKFPHTSGNFNISFTANEFRYSSRVYYRYRLRKEDEWTRLKEANTIFLSAVPYGSYRLELQASYNNFQWSESAVYSFTIKTPWWKTTLFYVFAGLVVFFLLFLFYRYRIRHFKKVLAIRSKISQDLHDEVGATLSSIHIYSTVAEKTARSDPGKSLDALQQINSNTLRVMENMNDIVWAIKTDHSGGNSFEQKLKNFGFELLNPLNMQCTYRIAPEADRKIISMEARKNILLIAKEAMNNIAKYSRASAALIQLKIEGKRLVLEVSDNGRGFDTGIRRYGNGLGNMKERSAALGGYVEVHSEVNKGTKVLCSIPITNISDG